MSKERLFRALNLKTQFRSLQSRISTLWGHKTQSLLAIGLLMLLLLYAYSKTPNYHQKFTSSPKSTLANLRIVKHQLDEAKLPISPKRIIVLDGALTEAVLALGITPVGAPIKFINYTLSPRQQADIEDIGTRTPNLEKILALKPDLILGVSNYQEIYGLLSHIAPTVLINYSYSKWKEMFWSVAQILGQTTVAKEWMFQYYNHISEFKAAMGKRLALTHVSVFRIAGYTVFIKGSFFSSILNDIGLKNPLSGNLDALSHRHHILTNGYVYALSPELLKEIDGDALFLISDTSFGLAVAQKAFEQLQVQPLWSKLKVVRQGKVYVVGNYWICCGPLAANQVLDDLFKSLLETSNLK
jgi:iron complex transport system substrate-binding protein